MHKHLKAELVAPDHINSRLSAGISEAIEMMMAKDPAARYQSCRDIIMDLKFVREGKSPPLAHKDFKGADLAGLAQAEAAAPAELATDQALQGAHSVRPWLIWVLGALLVISVAVNVFLIVSR